MLYKIFGLKSNFISDKATPNKFSVSRPGLRRICMQAGSPFSLFHYIKINKPLLAWHHKRLHKNMLKLVPSF